MAGTLVRVFVWVTESRWHNGCLPSRRCDGPALGRCRRERTAPEFTMQYIYTMIGVSKTVPPTRQIIKDISLSFRSEEHTSELQSPMRRSYAVFCLKTKKYTRRNI